jgi:hypothetical protein
MNKYILLLVMGLLIAGCSNPNNKKKPETVNTDSIHKVWEFKNIDTGTASGNLASVRISKNLLDLTNKDTLRLSYHNTKNPPTRYPYKIVHDTIFVQNGMIYKILALKGNELKLSNSYVAGNSKDSTTIVMVYGAKK